MNLAVLFWIRSALRRALDEVSEKGLSFLDEQRRAELHAGLRRATARIRRRQLLEEARTRA